MINLFSRLFNKKKSELTHEKMESLLKESYKEIVVCHIDTGDINQKIYNGVLVAGVRDVASKMPEFKQMWEQCSDLQDLRPVMIVAKTARYKTERASINGTDVYGNVIVWDKKKKNYYALSPKWFFVCSHLYCSAASEWCLCDVADYVRCNIRMLENFARNKSR